MIVYLKCIKTLVSTFIDNFNVKCIILYILKMNYKIKFECSSKLDFKYK
jgi:hypothetical protein